ncbi:MAG: phage portal protein, partial [Ruminococcus flavefaciens]|nr:phage portal protein [Ruminococcus flavefaciens]
MEFIRQEINGVPSIPDILDSIRKAELLYATKIDRMTKLYNNKACDESLFNLYKQGLETQKIERLRFPIAKYITTILSNYMLGEPPRYEYVSGAPEETDTILEEARTLYRRQSKSRLDKELKKQCGKTGFAYELVFYDGDTLTPKSVQLPVKETLVVFDYGIERNSLYAVHHFRKDKKTYSVMVYTNDLIIEYETRS